MKNYVFEVPITVEDDADVDKICCAIDSLMTDALDGNKPLGVVVTGDCEPRFVNDIASAKETT